MFKFTEKRFSAEKRAAFELVDWCIGMSSSTLAGLEE